MSNLTVRPPALTASRGFCERNAVKLVALGFLLSGIWRFLARFNGDLQLSLVSDALFLLFLTASIAGFVQRFRRWRIGQPAPTTDPGESRDDLLFTVLKKIGLWIVWLALAIPVMFLWAFMSAGSGLTLYILSGGLYGALTVAGIRTILGGRFKNDLLGNVSIGLIVSGFVLAPIAIWYGWIMPYSTDTTFMLICRQMSISGITGMVFSFIPMTWRARDHEVVER